MPSSQPKGKPSVNFECENSKKQITYEMEKGIEFRTRRTYHK